MVAVVEERGEWRKTDPWMQKLPVQKQSVLWVHDYQEACVDRIERWIRGDNSIMMDRFLNSQPSNCSAYSGTNSTFNRQNTYLRTVSQDNSSCNSGDGNSPPTPPAIQQKEIEQEQPPPPQ